MEKCKVVLLPAAYADLDEIFHYIMLDSPKAAEKVLNNIMHSLQRLQNMPYSGSPLLEPSLVKFDFKNGHC